MGTQRIQLKRGLKANLPTTGMLAGEAHFTTDRGTLHIATDATTKLPVVPAIDDLVSMSAIDGAADLLIINDGREAAGQKEKKVTFAAFNTALNIPEASTDEKVAVISGGTSGYLWGTDGNDGILRHSTGIKVTKDASNAFITLDVDVVDGGTF